MAAASFTMLDHRMASAKPEIEPGIMAVAVASAAAIVMLIGLITAFFDRKLATLTAHEAELLKRSEERLRALNRNASDIIAILDSEGTIVYESSSAWHILGYRTKELLGRQLSDFVDGDAVEHLRDFLALLSGHLGHKSTTELQLQHADGSWRNFEVIGKNLLGEPAIDGIVVNMRDITERKRLMAELERLSETDALTNTLNRRGFLKLAERECERARRTKASMTFVMLDIDHFKSVNDRFGHAAGDMVLAMVAERCRKHIRSVDLLGRFGGEEFILLLTDSSVETAEQVVERLQAEISSGRVATIKGEIGVTASFGLATFDPLAQDVETAIRLADEALYEAKNSGRDCIRIRA